MQTFHKVINTPFDSQCVFRVPTSSRGDVYMRVFRSNYMNDERAVVEVDADRFLALWREQHSSHTEIAHGDPSTWPDDYKFADAEDGFIRGEPNPVPLAEVNFQTWAVEWPVWRRRYWLFKEIEGYERLPVECGINGAHELQRLAGIPGGQIRTVEELLPKKRWDEFFSA